MRAWSIPRRCTEVPVGEQGEIIIHGPMVFAGYWKRPEATAAAFIEFEGKRFFRSGDLGRMDEDGYFFLTDRLKRMINASGFKVWPAEVEALMFRHPAIQEACVISAKDSYRGETVKAVVVLRASHKGQVSEQDIIDWCRENMAVYKVPRIVQFADALPKSGSGKVMWRTLQEAGKQGVDCAAGHRRHIESAHEQRPRAQHRLAGKDRSRRGAALRRLCQQFAQIQARKSARWGAGPDVAPQAAHGRAGHARGAGRPARVRAAWPVCQAARLRRLGAAFQRRPGPRAGPGARHTGLCAAGVRRAGRVGAGQRPGQEPGLHAHQPGGVRLFRQRRIRRFRGRRVARQWRPGQIPLQALWLAGRRRAS